MSDDPKVCPNCGAEYPWYENECRVCHVALIEQPAGRAETDLKLVSVFKTGDAGVLPLATMALDEEQIGYLVRHGGSDLRGWTRQAATPTDAESIEILVSAENADKARDLLVDLENPVTVAAASSAAIPADPSSDLGIQLVDAETGATVGHITEAQLQFLLAHLEKESVTDQDYYLDAATIDLLDAAHADAALLDVLRRALDSREGIDIRWSVG